MWLIKLKGKEETLHELCTIFSDKELLITKADSTYFLTADTLSEELPRRDIYEAGEAIIEFLNSSLKLYSNQYEAIESNGYCHKTPDGEIKVIFHAIYTPNLTIRVQISSYPSPEAFCYTLYKKYHCCPIN